MTWQNHLQAARATFSPPIANSWAGILTDCCWASKRSLLLSWEGFFLSNTASSASNRCSPLTKWEPARQMSPASFALSYPPTSPSVYMHVLDGTSWLQSESRLFTDSLGNIRNMWLGHMKGAPLGVNTQKHQYMLLFWVSNKGSGIKIKGDLLLPDGCRKVTQNRSCG